MTKLSIDAAAPSDVIAWRARPEGWSRRFMVQAQEVFSIVLLEHPGFRFFWQGELIMIAGAVPAGPGAAQLWALIDPAIEKLGPHGLNALRRGVRSKILALSSVHHWQEFTTYVLKDHLLHARFACFLGFVGSRRIEKLSDRQEYEAFVLDL